MEKVCSWDNSYCVRLIIVLLPVNIGKLQSLVSKDNFFCWVYKDFCCDFLLYDVIDFASQQLQNNSVWTNVSNKDALSICKRLLRSIINKRNKELQHLSNELSLSKNFLSTQLSAVDFYIITKPITLYNKKSLQKSLCTQKKILSSLMRDCNLPIFTANETIINLTEYELSQEEFELLKAGLYFSIKPDKIRKCKIFTTFEKIHCSFLDNLKSGQTKSQIKVHLLYLADSYFYNYKLSPCILRQHRILHHVILRENKDIVITKPNKGNRVVILDWKLYYNAIDEVISDTSKSEKLSKDQPWSAKLN